MIRRLPVLCCAALLALLPGCGTETEVQPQPDASLRDAGSPRADSGPDVSWDAAAIVDEDAGEPADAGTSEPDAGEIADAGNAGSDAGLQQADAGQAVDGGDPHAGANRLEYCGTPSLAPERTLTVTLNGQAIDFAAGYSWGTFSPATSSFEADATFTWTSTDGQYFLELVVREAFSSVCPATLALPSSQVILNLYDNDTLDLYSSSDGASGTLKLDAYDLAGGACSVGAECQSCRLVWGSDVAVIDGRVVESCL